jgi:long-chain acyl-CoA synthetase
VITLVDRYLVTGEPADFEQRMRAAVGFMAEQPGFVGQRLVRSVRLPTLYYNIAQWDSMAMLQAAVRSPDFAVHVENVNAIATSEPHPCETILDYVPSPS